VEEAQEEERIELGDDEQDELKRLYREASKKCHPDVVSEEEKEEAETLFIELQEAYERSDLVAVRSIAERIEGGRLTPRSTSVSTLERLEAEVKRLKQRIQSIRNEIDALQTSDAYQTLAGIEDFDAYFADQKDRLRARLDDLKSEMSST